MLNVLLAAIAGLVLGVAANILRGHPRMDWVYLVTGVGTSVISVFIASLVGVLPFTNGVNISSLLSAVMSTSILLLIIGRLRNRNTSTGTTLVPMELQRDVSKNGPKPQPPTSEPPPPPASVGPIFISYRREDAPDTVGRVYDRLVQHFGTDRVYKDVDSIPFGVDFRKEIASTVSRCSVLLAIIGPRWAGSMPSNGTAVAPTRRIDDARDFVRLELEAALQRDIPVVPILVHNTPVPAEQELPPSLQSLTYRNGLAVRPDPDFHRDIDRLIDRLDTYLQSQQATTKNSSPNTNL